MSETITFRGGPVFDGLRLHEEGHAARFRDGRLEALLPAEAANGTGRQVDLAGDILSPGYVDLQVNGGGGAMLGDAPDVENLRRIAAAHRALGTMAFLPTLITDRPNTTRAAVAATRTAISAGIPGIVGLHLEGPHLSPERGGAHDKSLIRPMTGADLDMLLEAADALPALMVTLAPEGATRAQVARLAQAGVIVSLGHTEADFETCMAYFEAGARCATHLFNAMSQMGSRAPGLVGAALGCGAVSAGLIADGLHVHPASMATAWRAKAGPGGLFLVTDAMAVAGTALDTFDLGERRVHRRDGALRLQDGTLAGADLDLTGALRVLTRQCGVRLEAALAAATSRPAGVIGLDWTLNGAAPLTLEDCIRIRGDLSAAEPLAGSIGP